MTIPHFSVACADKTDICIQLNQSLILDESVTLSALSFTFNYLSKYGQLQQQRQQLRDSRNDGVAAEAATTTLASAKPKNQLYIQVEISNTDIAQFHVFEYMHLLTIQIRISNWQTDKRKKERTIQRIIEKQSQTYPVGEYWLRAVSLPSRPLPL